MSGQIARLADHVATAAPLAPKLEALAKALHLEGTGIGVDRARIVGRGSSASADIWLTNGQQITFETMRDVATPKVLQIEVAMATEGRVGRMFTGKDAAAVVATLRACCIIAETISMDDLAEAFAVEYLRRARPLPVAMTDQAQRWQAFRELAAHEPLEAARRVGKHPHDTQFVLLDADSCDRFVRCGWLIELARFVNSRAGSEAQILDRMLRVGWQRRGTSGRVKATDPSGRQRPLGWSFLIVEAGWEDHR